VSDLTRFVGLQLDHLSSCEIDTGDSTPGFETEFLSLSFNGLPSPADVRIRATVVKFKTSVD
jgi:hypothetical protein